MTQLKIVKPQTEAQRTTHTTVDTVEVTPALVKEWRLPPFQREKKVNAKVLALAETIKADGGVIPGVITLGVLDRVQYLIDGQHRREAFLISKCETGYVDVRMRHFESMDAMGEEFVALNSQLVRMTPNDVLRGLEGTNAALTKLRRRCPFVGYDQIRRGERTPLLGMATTLRAWFGSAPEVPKAGGGSAFECARTLTVDDVDVLADFLSIAMEAWGRDEAYQRLWLSLNMTLSMWSYRRLVIAPYSAQTPKLTKEQFKRCLMSLSAANLYVDWLVGRQLTDRDRAPAYARMKGLFATRLEADLGKRVRLPNPTWSHT